jgi:hypothetical protein
MVSRKCYDCQTDANDNLTVSNTQMAKIKAMLDDFNISNCNTVRSPYLSCLTIDSIACDDVASDNKPEIVKPYQQMVGSLNWLSINTQPDLAMSVSLLLQFMQNPSSGHILANRWVLAWLSGTWYTQGGPFTVSLISWVDNPSLPCSVRPSPKPIRALKMPPILAKA